MGASRKPSQNSGNRYLHSSYSAAVIAPERYGSCRDGKLNCSLDISFEKFSELYFEDLGKRIRESTLATKRSTFNKHLLPYFGQKCMRDILPRDIIAWQNNMLEYLISTCFHCTIYLLSVWFFSKSIILESSKPGNPCGLPGLVFDGA